MGSITFGFGFVIDSRLGYRRRPKFNQFDVSNGFRLESGPETVKSPIRLATGGDRSKLPSLYERKLAKINVKKYVRTAETTFGDDFVDEKQKKAWNFSETSKLNRGWDVFNNYKKPNVVLFFFFFCFKFFVASFNCYAFRHSKTIRWK